MGLALVWRIGHVTGVRLVKSGEEEHLPWG